VDEDGDWLAVVLDWRDRPRGGAERKGERASLAVDVLAAVWHPEGDLERPVAER
jgi:hypothetical protein